MSARSRREFVCKKERPVVGDDGCGWLRVRRERSRRKPRTPTRKSFFRTACRFRLSRPILSRGCRRFRFRPEAGRCSVGRPERRHRQWRRREHERRRREQRRQRRRLQHDDGAELGLGCSERRGSDGRERDGARSDVCDGVKLPERRSIRRRQCVWRVPDDQLDLYRGHQWRPRV